MDAGQPRDLVAAYRGTARVRLRIRAYHGKGTTGARMSVYANRLRFRGVGIHSWELRTYEVAREEIDGIYPMRIIGVPWVLRMFPGRKFGILIVSKPGGVFSDRDEYTFQFDTPELTEVLTTLRSAGYPVMETESSAEYYPRRPSPWRSPGR
jgi:hypothetical protein